MVSPYLVPGEAGVQLIRKLRGRGLTIQIITNSFVSTDVPLAQIGYMRYAGATSSGGVELYEINHAGATPQTSRDRSRFGGDFLRLYQNLHPWAAAPLSSAAPASSRSAAPSIVSGLVPAALHARPSSWIAINGFVGSFNFDPRSIEAQTPKKASVIRSPELA